MSIVDELQQYVDSNDLMGAWVQKGRGITHITNGMDTDLALNLGSLGVNVIDLYKSKERELDSFVFGYSSGQILFIKLRANLLGIAMPTGFEFVDELADGLRKAALKATLELLQAKPIAIIKEQAVETEDPGEAKFTRWSEFIDLAKSELTRVLQSSQVDMFIKIQLKGYEPTTIGEAFQAAGRIANGMPDKSKKNLLKKAFEDHLNQLV